MATKTVPCLCRSFEFGDFDADNPNPETYTTDCNQTTTRTFAMGHDAKLAGFLVRAELAGEEISTEDGGIRRWHSGAVGAAALVSAAFVAKVKAQLDASKARLAKKAAREATKAAKKSAKKAQAPAPTKREATIKVGRWPYQATIDPNGIALYNTKSGEAKSAKPGEYTEIS